MEVTRLFDIPEYTVQKYSKDRALADKLAGEWVVYSHKDFKEITDKVSYALMAAGVRPGDRVASICGNRPEWNFIDMGIMQAGAIHVPVYPVCSNNDLIYILNEISCQVAFAGNNYTLSKLVSIRAQIPTLRKIITCDKLTHAEFFKDFIHSVNADDYRERLKNTKNNIQADDLATIIYTSGTIGNPKGVMLSHKNIITNFRSLAATLLINSTHTAVSYLPLCHIYERTMNYMFIYKGVTVFYAESGAGIADNIREVHPDIVTTVPLLLEKIHDNIVSTGEELLGFRKSVFNSAVHHAMKYPLTGRKGLFYSLQRWHYDRLVYNKWRAALGGRLKWIYCGGAALRPSVLQFFWAAGIRVYEGYGLTETSPVISSNNDYSWRLGTVGKVLNAVEVKIAEDGEILTRGPCVMLGYYFDPENTFDFIDQDGWFRTGDVGEFVERKFLKITGRKKVLFKTTSGEYVSPEHIENQIKQSPFISQVMIIGANQNYLGALIVPDFNYIVSWFNQKNLPLGDNEFLATHTLVTREIDHVIWNYNKNAFETERIRKFHVLKDEWTIDRGELTPKMSLKRNAIAEKYRLVIEGFFRTAD
jgi:long-chain acyl-CoA synthetase